jgi:hypothetical protein
MKCIINAMLTLALVGAFSLMVTNSAMSQQKGAGIGKRGAQFIDQNGDGVCDNFGTKSGQKMGNGNKGKGFGPGDGTGNKGKCPKDGTGYGSKSVSGTGTGICDGTGPKGNQGKRGRK